jgi:hypothetical protein
MSNPTSKKAREHDIYNEYKRIGFSNIDLKLRLQEYIELYKSSSVITHPTAKEHVSDMETNIDLCDNSLQGIITASFRELSASQWLRLGQELVRLSGVFLILLSIIKIKIYSLSSTEYCNFNELIDLLIFYCFCFFYCVRLKIAKKN